MKRIVVWVFGLLIAIMIVLSVFGGDDDLEAEPVRTEDTADVAANTEATLALGSFHDYDQGLTGTAWRISVDGYEWAELGPFAPDGKKGQCFIVYGSATAVEVDTDNGLSNPFSFPTVEVVIDGRKAPFDGLSCNMRLEDGRYQSMATTGEYEWEEGAEGGWYQQLWVPPGEVERVVLDGVDWEPPTG